MLVVAFLQLFVVALPNEAPTVVKAEPLLELDAKFQQKEGWIGGDGAFSVPLSTRRTLWLFSDTWLGTVRDGKRQKALLVNNTIGIQEGSGSSAELTFAASRSDDGKPKPIFSPPDGRGWFWLYAGLHSEGKLYAFLPRFEKTKDPGAFGFRSVDLWLGAVGNPDESPLVWKPTYEKVPFADVASERKRSFGSAILRSEDRIYVYGYEERPGKPFPSRKLLTARVPEGKLGEFDSWRFFADDDKWSAFAADARGQIDGLATEFSVSYIAALKRYALVYTQSGLSDRIVGRFATSPEGPWSAAILLYTCPEMKKNDKVFTYAAKAHPHLAGDSELVVSYVANAFDFNLVLNDAELYWPRFVRIALK